MKEEKISKKIPKIYFSFLSDPLRNFTPVAIVPQSRPKESLPALPLASSVETTEQNTSLLLPLSDVEMEVEENENTFGNGELATVTEHTFLRKQHS